MARLLVFDRDNAHADPAVDRDACYKRGDVVYVAEDDHVFSALEQQEPFRIVDVPGLAADHAYLLEGEARTLRDDYPAALIAVRRLHKSLRTGMAGTLRRRRRWLLTTADEIQPKPMGTRY